MMQTVYSALFQNAFFGIVLTIGAFSLGRSLNKKLGIALLSPLIIAIAIIICFLLAVGIDYETYYNGASMIHFLLTPATVAFAIPLYRQVKVLKNNLLPILLGVFSGSIACLVSILVLGKLFHLSQPVFMGIMPKSVTTAIAVGIAEELGGITSVTCMAVIVTGCLGYGIAITLGKLFKIQNKVALGIAIGTCSHAIGTSKAMELDELVGAMSSLAIVVAGIMTVIFAPIIASFH